MKKGLLILSGIIIIALICTYLFIPSKINVIASTEANMNADAVFRTLRTETTWQKWWPGKIEKENQKNIFTWNGNRFSIGQISYNAFQMNTDINGNHFESLLYLVPGENNKVLINWETNYKASTNPFVRIKQYLYAKKLENAFTSVLSKIKSYVQSSANVYGFDIQKEKVAYEYVTTSAATFNHDPLPKEIYSLVGVITSYVEQNGGKVIGYPILNITSADSAHFETRIAIPTNKKLSSTNTILSKWMMKGGYILTTEVKGGKRNIEQAMQQVNQFLIDNHYSRIAIPFQSLITNRLNEPDTNKWITKVYYPVI
ncbi:MAG: GyrI-like protein [Chitinophagaceae bacterium]|nr:GyrI-like protein [Chitinophagaceae bacterium]